MNLNAWQRPASMVIAGATLLYLLNLFLGWTKVAVDVGGVLNVEDTASGWAGWGALAGVLAIGLLVLAVGRLRTAAETSRRTFLTAAFAVALLIATGLAAFTGEASVDVAGGSVAVEVETTLWPAWVGVGLAVVIAGAALLPLGGTSRAERSLHRVTPSGAA